MNILITANAAWNVWNFRSRLVSALIDGGGRVRVLAPADDSVPRLEGLGCEFTPFEMSVKGVNPFADFQIFRRYRQDFLRHRPDVILSYTIKNNVYGALAAKSAGIGFIPNVTGLGTAFLSGSAMQMVAESLYKRAFSSLPVIFFQNEDDCEFFISRRLIGKEQARVIPGSGIDLGRFQATRVPDHSGAPVFLMIARLLRDKGVVEFVEAAKKLRSIHPDARFQLLGPMGAENRSAIDPAVVKSWIDEGLVEYLGEVGDVRPFINTASCVVLPSYREGAPRTLIEAAAMSRPLIATDVPGCRAVVEHGKSGFLCEARSADSLAGAMLKFVEASAEQKSEMGLAGRRKMEREFDDARISEAYLHAIESVLGKR